METPASNFNAAPFPTPVVGAEAAPAAPVFPAAEVAGPVAAPFAAEAAAAPVTPFGAEAAAPAAEQPGWLRRVATKAGEYASKAAGVVADTARGGYAYATTKLAEANTPEGRRAATLAFAAGAFALNAYSHRQGGGEIISSDVLAQTHDPMNVELVAQTEALPTDAGHTDILAGGNTTPVAEQGDVLAAPSPDASHDPLFDHNGGGTEEQRDNVLVGAVIAGGVVASGLAYRMATRRARASRHRANEEREFHHQAAEIRRRAQQANAELAQRDQTRRTGAPLVVNTPDGRRRIHHIAYDPATGDPFQVPVPHQNPLREYRPAASVPPVRRRRNIFRRMFGNPPVKPR
jgi:hypothetical protein